MTRRVAVLEVHVPHAVAELTDRRHRVAAGTERPVAGVEAQPERSTGSVSVEQPPRLGLGLDERADVRVA